MPVNKGNFMKLEREQQKVVEKKVFKPIRLILTIESEEELKELWHRFNIPTKTIKKAIEQEARDFPVSFPEMDSTYRVWEKIHNLCTEHGLCSNGYIVSQMESDDEDEEECDCVFCRNNIKSSHNGSVPVSLKDALREMERATLGEMARKVDAKNQMDKLFNEKGKGK